MNQPAATQTLWMLMAEFSGRPSVPLADCLHHLGYSTTGEANRAAIDNKLPVPTFRSRDSQRAPRQVHLTDLAAHIDAMQAKAAASWRAVNNITEPEQKPATSTSGRRNNA